ncbi:ABC transporter ATP-binding protein [Streptomyces chromofuscus]|uniref:ABC transporter ATP-binding protein n=1 Tax=Streptomyces chromofuscus TaxID=42881 RepID=A0A7M2T7P5_STRCW|nr:ABC transporter ATP-binding protein [Streptomyces chromofuscus]
MEQGPQEGAPPTRTDRETDVSLWTPAVAAPGVAPRDAQHAVRLHEVTKRYGQGPRTVVALDRISVDLPAGTFTAVMGPSGSGKSTFLHCAAGLDRPTSGSVMLGATELSRMKEAPLTRLRRRRMGFVFQAFNLVPSLTVEQNIVLPLRLERRTPDQAWFQQIVARMGLSERLHHVPAELSGGQQQRVAIARALVTRPDVIFADEPTGALDPATAHDILVLLRQAVTDMHQTVVMVTHDPVAAAHADSVVFLADGSIVSTLTSPTADRVAAIMTGLRRAAA